MNECNAILRRWNLEQLVDKYGGVDIVKWLNCMIRSEGFERTDCLFHLLLKVEEVKVEEMILVIKVIMAKFGPFVRAKEGEFELWNKSLI
jgi:hypothetical protein